MQTQTFDVNVPLRPGSTDQPLSHAPWHAGLTENSCGILQIIQSIDFSSTWDAHSTQINGVNLDTPDKTALK